MYFSGNIIAVLTVEKTEPPFRDMAGLVGTDYMVAVLNSTVWQNLFEVSDEHASSLYDHT